MEILPHNYPILTSDICTDSTGLQGFCRVYSTDDSIVLVAGIEGINTAPLLLKHNSLKFIEFVESVKLIVHLRFYVGQELKKIFYY